MKRNDYFTVLDNQTTGQNIARYRKLRGLELTEAAGHIGISEEAFLNIEKGESDITIRLVQKIGEMMNIDPVLLLTQRPGHFIGGIHHSPFGGIGNYVGGNFQMQDEKQTQLMIKLMENMLVMSNKLIEKLENLQK